MSVMKCDIPACSVLDRGLIDAAYFRDAYRAPLAHPQAGIIDIFRSIFAHHPLWMKLILIVRNRIASFCGLEAPTVAEILNFEVKDSYRVGDKIGVWPILALNDTEIVAGRKNGHLDFQLSVLKLRDGDAASVVVSTICVVNNTFGKVYLFFIVPFHKWGVQRILSNAISAGRL